MREFEGEWGETRREMGKEREREKEGEGEERERER